MDASMKKNHLGLLLSAILLLSAANSCHWSEAERTGGIEFDLLTSGEPSTKVSFLSPDGNETIVGQRALLYWSKGDAIRIRGENAGRTDDESLNWQDYQVSSIAGMDNSGTQNVASVNCSSAGNSLKWLDLSSQEAARFYALYPSPSSLEGFLPAERISALGVGVTLEGVVTGYIPGSQALVRRSNDPSAAGYNTFDAPMRFAYMGSSQSGLPGSRITLPFQPLFTAFEFKVCANDAFPEATITRMLLYNAGLTLCGAFSANISGDEPVVTPSGTGEAIEVTFPDGGATARKGQPVVMTVLALGCRHSELTIVFEGPAIGRRSLTFREAGNILSFEGRRRYRFGELSFPSTLGLAYGEEINWNGLLNDGETLDWDGSKLNWGEGITWE